MKWYILYILIGILLFLFINNINRFSIGIPFLYIPDADTPISSNLDQYRGRLWNTRETMESELGILYNEINPKDIFEVPENDIDAIETSQTPVCASRVLRHRYRGESGNLPLTRPGTPNTTESDIPEACLYIDVLLNTFNFVQDFQHILTLRATCQSYQSKIDDYIDSINPILRQFLFNDYWISLRNREPKYIHADRLTYQRVLSSDTLTVIEQINSNIDNLILGLRIRTRRNGAIDYIEHHLVFVKNTNGIYLLLARKKRGIFKYTILKKLNQDILDRSFNIIRRDNNINNINGIIQLATLLGLQDSELTHNNLLEYMKNIVFYYEDF